MDWMTSWSPLPASTPRAGATRARSSVSRSCSSSPSTRTDAESRLHRPEARDVARKGMVLLKNQGDVLPLKRNSTIALIGPLADSKRDVMGSWSAAGKAFQAVTVLEGMGHATRGKGALLYAKGANVTNDEEIIKYLNEYNQDVVIDKRSPQAMIDEAVAKAKMADVVVAVVGEAQGMAHEASSKANLRISMWFLLPVGLATGLLAATIAVGGFVGVPGMIYVLGATSLVASATELVIAFVMGLAGSINWAMHGMIDIRLTLIILAGSLLGVQLGAIGTTFVKEHMIKIVMGSIMLIVALSRGFAMPKYLGKLGLMEVSDATVAMLDKVSFAFMVVSLVVGAVIILGSMIRAKRPVPAPAVQEA